MQLTEAGYDIPEGDNVTVCVEVIGSLERDINVNISTVEVAATGLYTKLFEYPVFRELSCSATRNMFA